MSVSRVGKRELKELRVVTKNKKILFLLFLLLPLFSRCERDFQIKRETEREREATEIIFLFLISNSAGVDVTREG